MTKVGVDEDMTEEERREDGDAIQADDSFEDDGVGINTLSIAFLVAFATVGIRSTTPSVTLPVVRHSRTLQLPTYIASSMCLGY